MKDEAEYKKNAIIDTQVCLIMYFGQWHLIWIYELYQQYIKNAIYTYKDLENTSSLNELNDFWI